MNSYNNKNTIMTDIYKPKVLDKKSNIKVNNKEDKEEDKDIVVIKSLIISKFDSSIRCINCSENHKFSPFNVTKKSNKNIIKVIGMIELNYKFIVKTIDNVNEYNRIDKEIIEKNELPENYIFSWSDDLDMFNSDNGLIKLLHNNRRKFNFDTITYLLKTILCPDWWDDFFVYIASNPYEKEILIDSILLAEKYKKFAILKAEELDKIVKDYEFPKFIKILRTLRERQKRENEAKSQKELEELRKQKELEAINRLEEQKIKLELKQQKELDTLNIKKILSPIEQFTQDLDDKRKGNNYKFLASINPDETIIADLVMKSGEKSQLNIGIESEDIIKKIKLWEYYLQQQKDIVNKIKYKKVEWKKKEDSNEIPEIPKPKILLVLSSSQKLQYERIYDEYKKENKTNNLPTFILDEWQSLAINYIRNNKSCLITGPTSGGKTYVMMKGLDNIINNSNDINLVYVSPTFHLAYQTYANINATFPKKIVAIITTEILCIPNNANIFIGTAPQLLNYFITTNKIFQIGIFDEIHVVSKLYFDQDNLIDVIRAKAYSSLLARCEKQIIAASATINNEFEMRKYIVNQTNQCRSELNKLSLDKDHKNYIYLVEYNKRAIPLNEYRFINNEIIEPITRSITGEDITIKIDNSVKINSENLFKLLIKMREKDMIPGIIFDLTDDIAWKSYVNMINYIELMESIDYLHYTNMIKKLNNIIELFNTDRTICLNQMPDSDNFDSSRIRVGSKGNNKKEAGIRSIKSKRIKAYKDIVNCGKTCIIKSIEKYNIEPWTSLCSISTDNIMIEDIRSILIIFEISKDKLFKLYPDFKITKAHIDMINIIKKIEDLDPDQNENLYTIKLDKGSFYRFTSSSVGIDQLKAIREPGSDENNWKLRKRMILLAEAQRIHPKDIDGIIDVIMRGLEFGITLINPSLPFVIQNIILDSLRTKNMGIVFASESMTMGINYALRFVIIKSPEDIIKINPSKLIQMGGRCGRRGKDTQAHVIYWGISNDSDAHHTSIPCLNSESFILNNNLTRSIISDAPKLAYELSNIFLFDYFEEEKKKSVSQLSYNINKAKITLNEEENDAEEYEKKKCNSRSKKIVLKRSNFIKPVIKILTTNLNYDIDDIEEISTMICKIDDDNIIETYNIDSFSKSRKINILMHMLIELHNSYAFSNHYKFLNFLEEIIHILQGCEYKLIKLAK
jgi:late competence protein required for DNA uptake (superfamily II DNA/RNA helicase)